MNKNQLKKIIKKSIDSKEVANIESGAQDSLAHLINFFTKLKFPQWFAEISAIKNGIFLIIIIQSCYILKFESRLSFKKVFTVFRVKF